MKLTTTIIGSLGQIMAEEVGAGEKAATAAVRQAGDGLKATWRAQIHRNWACVSKARS